MWQFLILVLSLALLLRFIERVIKAAHNNDGEKRSGALDGTLKFLPCRASRKSAHPKGLRQFSALPVTGQSTLPRAFGNSKLAVMSTATQIKSAAGGLVVSNPDILGGTPVFRGTRLPVQTLFDYLGDGLTLDYFLETFEGVARDDARAVLRHGWEHIAAELAE